MGNSQRKNVSERDCSLFGRRRARKDKSDATPSQVTRPATARERGPISEKEIIISRPTEEDVYNCDHPHVGVALIFNHKSVRGLKQRLGTEQDRDAMQRTLAVYGFDVRVFDDLTWPELSERLTETAAEDHGDRDCLVVVVMTHGTEGKVYARDVAYPVERLWSPFLGDNCKTLINKPKLFFIQACRGENLEKAVSYTAFAARSRSFLAEFAEQPPPPITYAIPNTADILVMYSTFDKHFSFRHIERGSWFIQSLCSVLDRAAVREAATAQGAELFRLLTAVNRKVAYEYQSHTDNPALDQMKEMPNFLSTLTKLFYLKVKREGP